MTPIFISYRRADSADVAGRIRDRLREQWGEGVAFLDVEGIPLGVDFRAHLARQLEGCRAFLVVIGKEWLSAKDAEGRQRLADPGDLVRAEVETALARGIPVVPLLVQGANMPKVDELPEPLRALADRNGTPIRPDPDFSHDMERLMRALAPAVGEATGSWAPVVETGTVAPAEALPPLRATRAAGLVRWLTLLIVAVALVQLAVFVVTDRDEVRSATVVAGSLAGTALVLAGVKRRRTVEVLLGAVGACAPWVLRLVLDSRGAVLCAAVAVLFLSAWVLRQIGWRGRGP